MMQHRFSFPTQIFFGPGVLNQTAEFLVREHISRPLIVTDRGLAQLGLPDEVAQLLAAKNLAVATFSDVFGNPTKSQVIAGVASYRSAKADAIIGLGGGAALDVAKAIALMINHPGDLFDYEDDLPGARPIDRDIPFFIAIPTTAGTGSEVGRSAVISDDQSHVKKIIFSPRLLAKAVFADPNLTTGLPGSITAATGFDALTHCVEAFLAKGFHPICDGIALEGLRLAAAHLERATQEPNNIEARSGMLMASMMGAIAFQKGLGVTHSCAHALGTICHMHHGLANAIMIDHALKHNAEHARAAFKRMAATIELEDHSSEGFLDWLKHLKKTLKIPAGLKEAKVERICLDDLVKVAVLDACHQNNPVPCTSDSFERIFNEAFI